MINRKQSQSPFFDRDALLYRIAAAAAGGIIIGGTGTGDDYDGTKFI
jgi:hypothetical protein